VNYLFNELILECRARLDFVYRELIGSLSCYGLLLLWS